MSDLRTFRKYSDRAWIVTPMSQLKVNDIMLAEDVFDTYYKVEKEQHQYEFEPGDFRNAIEVDLIQLPADIKPFWKNLNSDDAHVKLIQESIKENGGQCCCVIKSKQSQDTLCPCETYRKTRVCICKLYIDE